MYSFTKINDLKHDYMYIGYLTRKTIDNTQAIILYGKKNNYDLCFINTNSDSEKEPLCINLDDYDGYVSCKVVEKRLNICAYTINNILYLKFFYLFFKNDESDEKMTKDYPNIKIKDIMVLYDTEDKKYKILCSTKERNSDIVCFKIYIDYKYKSNDDISVNEANVTLLNMDKYNIAFSYNEENCNYTIYKSEYLLCCGKTDYIICERRDMELKLVNSFQITLPGKIRNLTLEKNNDNDEAVKLSYTNSSSEDKYIYEYYIYPPECNNTYLKLSHYQSKSLNLDNLFQRKTNTNYYITFNDILKDYGNIYINNELINEENIKIPLSMNENNFTFISTNNKTGENLEIKYNISIDETYSSEYSLYIAIKSCYHSCKSCLEEKPNNTHHYCLSCKVEEGFYPYSSSESYYNCFNKREMDSKHIPYYFNEELKIFLDCYPECQTCNGTLVSNCLSCRDINKFLYKGRCYSQCPDKTYPSDTPGNKFCGDCHQNCEICHGPGNSDKMNCLICTGQYIFYLYNYGLNLKNCYLIKDNIIKSFYSPYNNEIISCKDLNKYIKEDTNECINTIDLGYYISNNETNILSECHSSCKTCYGNYTDDDTNCIECFQDYYKTEDSNTNCILESFIGHNYYKNTSDNIYYKCHPNCYKCSTGFDSSTDNMNCIYHVKKIFIN